MNARPFQKLQGSRESSFEDLDKPALQPLPPLRYELTERRKTRVNIDYHIEYDHRYYSVPYALVHESVEVRATVVEIFLIGGEKPRHGREQHGYQVGERIATHARTYARRGHAVTDEAHRPRNHRDQVWPPERLVEWGEKFGPAVAQVVHQMLARYVIPEQAYRACLGVSPQFQ